MELQHEGNAAFNGSRPHFTGAGRHRPSVNRLAMVRLEKVRSIRRALLRGGCETDETLDVAIARLSEVLLPQTALRNIPHRS